MSQILVASLSDVSPFVALLKAINGLSQVSCVGSLSPVQVTYRGKVATLIFSDAGIQIQMEYKRVLQGN
jgi:hypothetical protein